MIVMLQEIYLVMTADRLTDRPSDRPTDCCVHEFSLYLCRSIGTFAIAIGPQLSASS